MRIAAVQATPVYQDLDGALDKACALIIQAAESGANLVAFPEAFISGYPFWVWFIPSGQTRTLRPLYADFVAGSISIPGAAVSRLCDAARDADVAVVMGVNERNSETTGSTVFNSLVYIGADGSFLGKHRKLVPTVGERFVYGQGDGSTLEAYDIPGAKIGGLICWENYMPLARFAMFAQGVQLYVAPTWDHGEPWLSTLRHIAKEGRVWVIGCCSAVRKSDVSAFNLDSYLGGVGEWINTGDSVIVDPDGKIMAGPAHAEETILFADVDPASFTAPRYQLDVTGHYSRPDVFSLSVDRTEKTQVKSALLSDGRSGKHK